jgi:hypothetical protein
VKEERDGGNVSIFFLAGTIYYLLLAFGRCRMVCCHIGVPTYHLSFYYEINGNIQNTS